MADQLSLNIAQTLAPVSQKIKELQAEGLSEVETKILAILVSLLQDAPKDTASNDTTGTASTASAAAASIDDLCPAAQIDDPATQASIEAFLMELWELLISLVSSVPYDHPAQDTIATFLQELRLRARRTVAVWGGMIEIRAGLEGGVHASSRIEKGVEKGIHRGIPEYSIPEYSVHEYSVPEYKLIVASQWILLAGKPIFQDAFRVDTLDSRELKMTAPGPLYRGKLGLCMDR
ncbi:hypothetical protein B0T25DRAFT_523360 [Lasiosphaeria hispida]|uniref:Uncharacterized protein n=1 Tax=Lasiosphaeria hispida TaxID=260671 RepID=A0AAJ0M7F1_9PEZI|nr:hypothetical protein B0T25DRAFT_523360 [Lasiosphaeria hispida]